MSRPVYALSGAMRKHLSRMIAGKKESSKVLGPLRLIVGRVQIKGRGSWDVLACGHRVRYYGDRDVRRRRCPECRSKPEEQGLLW